MLLARPALEAAEAFRMAQAILALATDFHGFGRTRRRRRVNANTMTRPLIEDVSPARAATVPDVHVPFWGGNARSFELLRPTSVVDLRRLDPAAVSEIDGLIDNLRVPKSIRPAQATSRRSWTR